MQKNMLKKIIICGIIILFFGASVVQGTINTGEIVDDNFPTENLMLDDWWDNNWLYRKQITIDSTYVDGNLNSFPVLVVHTSTDLADNAQPDGDDFVFTTVDGTKLNHEIEKYDSSSGELVAWVNIPSLSSMDDTIFYIYYGNDGCGNQEDVAGTWNSNFWMVQHLNEDGTGIRQDSTSNNNDGTPGNYDGDEATDSGKIDGGDYLDGSDDYMTFSGYPTWTTYTISCWIKLEDKTGPQFLFEIYSDYFMGNPHEIILHFFVDKNLYNYFVTSSEHAGLTYITSVAANSEWHYLVGAKTSTNTADVYVDGNYQHTHTGTFDTPEYMVIGCDDYHDVCYTKGTFDEVRTSKIARSSAWISTEYNNQNDPDSFMTFGEQEGTVIEIGDVTGGFFKVKSIIKNTGQRDATDVDWRILVNGGLILAGQQTFGIIDSLPAGEEVTEKSNLVFGIGNVVVTVEAEMLQVTSDSKDAEAFVLVFFILM